MDRQYISERTGFDKETKFADAEEVRDYFQLAVLRECYNGPVDDLPSDEELQVMAEIVIENRWHMEMNV